MEIEEVTSSPSASQPSPRFKPNRVCVVVCVVGFTFTLCIYHHFHIPARETTPLNKAGVVNVIMDERNPYNVTITSSMDIIQSYDVHGTRIEISVRDLMENKTKGPVRITRSGESYDVNLLYKDREQKTQLTKLDEIKPNPLNVFFIESRCGTKRQMANRSLVDGVVMNARQICSVESAARMNPSRPIYILHTCPLDEKFCEKSPKFVQQLMSYPNVHVVQLNMADFFIRTNVEELYFRGRFDKSKHPIEHVSDVVRLLTLWKYGGTYMDIDVVSIRPLDDLGGNYAGWQDDRTIASGVLNFQPTGFGHDILTECLDDLRFNFEPNSWSTNGPILITNTLMRLCSIHINKKQCSEFTAYPVPVFYPIYYNQWRLFFEEKHAEHTLNQLNDTYVVHLWNKMSCSAVINVGSKQAYAQLADKYCPKAYSNCGTTF